MKKNKIALKIAEEVTEALKKGINVKGDLWEIIAFRWLLKGMKRATLPSVLNCRVAIPKVDTYEGVLENIKDAIRLHMEDRLEAGEEIPQAESVSFTSHPKVLRNILRDADLTVEKFKELLK